MPGRWYAGSVRLRGLLASAGTGLLLGCASMSGGPMNDPVPVLAMPLQYQEATGAAAGLPAAAGADGVEWWHVLGNKELDALIDRGLANNPDMRVAVQHIIQAKARYEQARASHLPTVTAPLTVGDQSGGSGSSLGAPPTGGANTSTNSPSQRTWQGSIRADWQLDLWGEQSALATSARFQLEKAIHERENVARNLAAGIATLYVQYLGLNDRRRIANETEVLQTAALASIEARVAAGDATLADLEQQRAAIFSVRASLPALEQQRIDALQSLALLVGTIPARLTLSREGLDTLRVPAPVAALPAELLLRRPDIRMAEAQLRAARADVEVARARLLPPMDLAAQIGRSALSPAQLLLPQTLFWSVVNNLTVTIFDGDRRKNEENFSHAVEEEMVENYARAARQAIREVEGSLATLRLSGERLSAQRETLDAARRAMDISTRIYKVGGVDYLTLLDTQRTYHRYLDDFQQAREGELSAHISLYQALGGDTRLPGSPPASPLDLNQRITGACLQGLPGDAGQPSAGGDWQVELNGNYHCATVAPAWRDLQTRYPEVMAGHVLRPVLAGRIEDARDSEQSWFHLAISRFVTEDQAKTFCQELQIDQLRCRVTATQAARPVAAGIAAAVNPAPSRLTSAPVEAGTDGAGGTGSALTEGIAISTDDAPHSTAAAGKPAVSARKGSTRGAAARYLQLGVFRDAGRAAALAGRAGDLLRAGEGTVSLHHDGLLTVVLAGPFRDAESAQNAAARLREVSGSTPRRVAIEDAPRAAP